MEPGWVCNPQITLVTLVTSGQAANNYSHIQPRIYLAIICVKHDIPVKVNNLNVLTHTGDYLSCVQ